MPSVIYRNGHFILVCGLRTIEHAVLEHPTHDLVVASANIGNEQKTTSETRVSIDIYMLLQRDQLLEALGPRLIQFHVFQETEFVLQQKCLAMARDRPSLL